MECALHAHKASNLLKTATVTCYSTSHTEKLMMAIKAWP